MLQPCMHYALYLRSVQALPSSGAAGSPCRPSPWSSSWPSWPSKVDSRVLPSEATQLLATLDDILEDILRGVVVVALLGRCEGLSSGLVVAQLPQGLAPEPQSLGAVRVELKGRSCIGCCCPWPLQLQKILCPLAEHHGGRVEHESRREVLQGLGEISILRRIRRLGLQFVLLVHLRIPQLAALERRGQLRRLFFFRGHETLIV
mmetsp:Transcript_63087/g.137094  ORF Transcript_63087/g.137094 Transcript_63087/m.137094 type:complete len:204 (-) Transcript_63087:330-941(-)